MAERNSIAIGLASGIGNAVFMLPAIKALKEQGNRIKLHVETDYDMLALLRRCAYADEIVPAHQNTNGDRLMCGQWRPKSWARTSGVLQFQTHYPYRISEWRSNLRLAANMVESPDVSDWCTGLKRTARYDIGIVPGSKGGTWIRKRYPGMKDVAAFYLAEGERVAIFGTDSDGLEEIPGEAVRTDLAGLPEALASCRLIVGTDSGVTHLASSLGIPCVIIFTATSEVKGEALGPHVNIVADARCRPCQSLQRWWDCRDWKCREIEPARIIQAVNGLLNA